MKRGLSAMYLEKKEGEAHEQKRKAGTAQPNGRKLRILDLFCCAGGAGVGYNRAGFEVRGRY